MREGGDLITGANAARKRVATFALDSEIRFASAADRAAFADELTAAVVELASRYHHDDGRVARLVVAAHPTPADESGAQSPSSNQTEPEENR